MSRARNRTTGVAAAEPVPGPPAAPAPDPARPREDGSVAPASFIDPVEWLAILLWVRGPRALIRRFPSLWGVAGDGHALVVVPPLALLAPIVVPAGAFVVGAGHLGYDTVCTESLALVAAVVALGAFSGQLGVLAVAGFALGEQLTGVVGAGEAASGEVRLRAAMALSHLLLGVAAVLVPRLARALAVAVGRWRRVPAPLVWPLTGVAAAVVLLVALRTWVAVVPLLLRPRFDWIGLPLPVRAFSAVDDHAAEVAGAGVLAVAARHLLQGLALWWAPVRDRVRVAEGDRAPRVGPTGRRAPGRALGLVGDAAAVALATALLAGVLGPSWRWLLAVGALTGARLLGAGRVAGRATDAWRRLVGRVPVVARVVMVWLAARVAADALLPRGLTGDTRLALASIAGAVVVVLAFPGAAPVRGSGGGGPAPEGAG